MASSEEIAAALEVAIFAMDMRHRFGETAPSRDYVLASIHLRSHLSRLREEAEFRDAARAYCLWREEDLERASSHDDFAYTLVRAYRAVRALEEPRDAS